MDGMELIKREHLADGHVKLILKNPGTGQVTQPLVQEHD